MPEGLSLPSGDAVPGVPVDVEAGNADFARMMSGASASADGRPSQAAEEIAAPPRRPVDTTDPGFTPNPKPKRGRPPKSEQARTTTAKPADTKPSKDGKPAPARDYTNDLNQLGEAVWLGLSQIPWTAAYAPLVNSDNRAPMVVAWTAAAQQSPAVRAKIEALVSGGGNSWVLGVAIATVPLAMTAYQIATNPDLRAAMAQQNRADVHTWAVSKGLVQVPEAEAA
jgi:hypothetical protein